MNEVAKTTVAMESPSGEKIVSTYKNTKTKVPLNLYFEKTTKNQVLFQGAYMEIYIPQDELERKTAIITGREVYTYGMFQIKIWDTIPERPENTPANHTTRYMYPSTFITVPTGLFKRQVSLVGEEAQPCMVLSYHKGDVFIKNTKIAKASDIAAKFCSMINKAFLSPIVRYTEIAELLFASAALNEVNFNVNATTLEIMIAAQARYAKDLTVPYRIFLNNSGTGDAKLDAASLKFVKTIDLPHILSTFTSFSFQNISYSILTSANRHRKGKTQKQSSVEEIIKY